MSFGMLNPWFELWSQIWKTQNLVSSLERPPLFSVFRLSDGMLARADKTCARAKNCVSHSSEHRASIERRFSTTRVYARATKHILRVRSSEKSHTQARPR
ncbi:hypothetical protein CsSME_00026983 [Camellia sinensis var. sinensis]